MLHDSLLVAIGGFAGAICRFAVSNWSKKQIPSQFPYGTLFVNLLGSLLLGLLLGTKAGSSVYLLCGTGFMGAFTTFSTFKLDSLQLGIHKARPILLAYLGISYTLGIVLAYAGFRLGALL